MAYLVNEFIRRKRARPPMPFPDRKRQRLTCSWNPHSLPLWRFVFSILVLLNVMILYLLMIYLMLDKTLSDVG